VHISVSCLRHESTPGVVFCAFIPIFQSYDPFFLAAYNSSNVEVQYLLVTFGIPMSVVQIRPDGDLIGEPNQQYLQGRRVLEAKRKRCELNDTSNSNFMSNSKNIIEFPSPKDIVLGRGRPFQGFSGNKQLTKLVEAKRLSYQAREDRFEKTSITMEIVKKVKENDG
jgi:hypothetical protein